MPEVPSGNRNLAIGTSSDWSSGWTSFNGQNNQTRIIYRIYNRGLKVGDKVNVRLVLKYSGIVTTEGQTTRILPQGEGNVTHYGPGGLNVGQAVYLSPESDEVVLSGTTIITENQLQNEYWNWRLRVDYVTSGHIMWKEAKAEISETATPYSQAPEDLGWSTATLVPTQAQRYLWKFEYIYYSDGSVKIAEPVSLSIAGATGAQGIQGLQGPKGDQGIQGPKGTDGKTQYTHIAYADNATGGGFSQTDQTKAYIGMYVDFTATDSNDPTKYRWSKWHGDKGATGAQGIQGPKGADGRTPYLHIAYANSADGRTDFSTSNSGNKRYLGTYTDYTQADSTDPTKYKWVDMVGSVEVGGVNLLTNRPTNWQNKYVVTYGASAGSFLQLNSTTRISPKEFIAVEAGKQYTISLKELTDVDYYFKVTMSTVDAYGKPNSMLNEDVWIYSDSYTFTAPENCNYVMISVGCGSGITPDDLNTKFNIKLEEGNIPTAYSKSPEDVQDDIDSKADSALTQQQLNALAEQNSIVKAEMEAKASIDTVNQWITAYQNYVNANDEAKAESEKNLQEAAARILQLKTDVGTLKQQWNFIDTYMSIQNEGLIIGKSDGSAYAKFSNDRISLFSGSSEVMYISQGVLRIENGIFTKTIQIGRFRFETHPADQDMLVLRYLGG